MTNHTTIRENILTLYRTTLNTAALTLNDIHDLYNRHVTLGTWAHVSDSGLRTRVNELTKDGWLKKSPEPTTRNRTGRPVHTWTLVTDPAERDALAAEHATVNPNPHYVALAAHEELHRCGPGSIVINLNPRSPHRDTTYRKRTETVWENLNTGKLVDTVDIELPTHLIYATRK